MKCSSGIVLLSLLAVGAVEALQFLEKPVASSTAKKANGALVVKHAKALVERPEQRLVTTNVNNDASKEPPSKAKSEKAKAPEAVPKKKKKVEMPPPVPKGQKQAYLARAKDDLKDAGASLLVAKAATSAMADIQKALSSHNSSHLNATGEKSVERAMEAIEAVAASEEKAASEDVADAKTSKVDAEKKAEKKKAEKKVAATKKPPSPEVAKLLAKMQKVSTGLDKVVQNPAMAKLRPSLQTFATELHHTLEEVETSTDMSDAKKLALLKDAQEQVAETQKKLVQEQEKLTKEDAEQKESVLMGVLMTRQNRPRAEQLEVLESADFKDLPVAKAVLAKNDEETPLFKQVATWLDAESKKTPAKKPAEKKEEAPSAAAPKNKAEAKAALEKVSALLSQDLEHMKQNLKHEEELQKQHMASLDAGFQKVLATSKAEEKSLAAAKTSANATKAGEEKEKEHAEHLKRVFAAMKKKESRVYTKWHAATVRDIHSLEESIEGIKKGDAKAVMKAKQALMASMQAEQAMSGNFLHFLQMGDSIAVRAADCPYCAAQCLEKCHAAGTSFVQCMSVACKDAGKGF